MKDTSKKINMDPLARVKESKNYDRYSEEADLKIRLAEEVFSMRQLYELSQKELAKKIGTTQKIISNIENADVNIGISLFYRIAKALKFTSVNLSKIYNADSLAYVFDSETNYMSLEFNEINKK